MTQTEVAQDASPSLPVDPKQDEVEKNDDFLEASEIESTEVELGTEMGSQFFHPMVVDRTINQRYEFYVRTIQLDRSNTGEALKNFCYEVERRLLGMHWLAEITENVPIPDTDIIQNRVRYLVEVVHVRTIECGSLGYELVAQCKFIKILDLYDDPELMKTDPAGFHVTLKQHLREHCCIADLTDLTPIEISDRSDAVVDELMLYQTMVIAELVNNFSFFLHRIHRHYDFAENNANTPFGPVLKSRLTMIDQIVNQKVPAGVRQRYTRVRTKYAEKLDQIDELENDYYDVYEFLHSDKAQDPSLMKVRSAQAYLDNLTKDVVHCHEERDMLAELLATWESFGLTCNGPRWPKRLRVANGRRHTDRKIAHITRGPVNVQLLNELCSDADSEFLTYPTMYEALQAVHEGETVFVMGATMQQQVRTGLHDLNENHVVIEGVLPGAPIMAPPGDDIFVNISGQDVVLRNLTLIADDNSDGIVRVESGGHAVLEHCILQCADGVGVSVAPGARLTMLNCEIHDAKLSAGVVQEPSGQVNLTNVKFVRCKGGVECQTLPENVLPEIKGCAFPDELDYPIVLNKIEKGYGETAEQTQPVDYRPLLNDSKENADDQDTETPIDADNIGDARAGGEHAHEGEQSDGDARETGDVPIMPIKNITVERDSADGQEVVS